MVYRTYNGATGALDYREKAPLTVHKGMSLDALGNTIPTTNISGIPAVGVPGTVAGVMEVHQKFGTLPLPELLEPVIALATNGVTVTKKQAKRLTYYKEAFTTMNGAHTKFAATFKEGDCIQHPELAYTLKKIAEAGKDGFYKGEVAQKLVAFLQGKGVYLTQKDLDGYEAKWWSPFTFSYKDLRIVTPPPSHSGGVTLSQILKMIAPYPISTYGHNSPKAIQLFTEAARRAFADRDYYLGDPDCLGTPLEELLSETYLKKRMQDFSFEKATPSSKVYRNNANPVESTQTTHYAIVDREGNAVSATTTLNGSYGSKLYCDELGFFLNNPINDFSIKSGNFNTYGVVEPGANRTALQKRTLSSMTPTVVEKQGKLYLVAGTPGGSAIITAMAQTILNVYEFNLSMQEAVNAPRFHHRGWPDEVVFEPEGFPEAVKVTLRSKGYKIKEEKRAITGKVDAIRVLPDGRLEGGADKRGDDTAAGF